MDFEVVVLLSECDGLIAEGGVGTIPGAPVSHAYTHNFLAMVHIEGWARWDPDLPLEASYVAHARITGTGIDAAGQTFTISGDVTSDRWHADFWADGGRVVVRRDDGSFAWGTGRRRIWDCQSAPVALRRFELDGDCEPLSDPLLAVGGTVNAS